MHDAAAMAGMMPGSSVVVLTHHGRSQEPVQAAHRDFPETNPLAAPSTRRITRTATARTARPGSPSRAVRPLYGPRRRLDNYSKEVEMLRYDPVPGPDSYGVKAA